MSVDEVITWLLEHWYIFVLIALFFIYSKYKDKETVGNLSLQNMFFIVEIGTYFMIIYFMQTRLFNEHNYFLLSIPLWLIIWGIAVNSILSKNDVYMVENSMMGEPFFDVINGVKILSLETRNRILIMDRDFYNAKSHIGETNNPLLKISNIVKYCDYYDSKTGIFYHSIYPQLQNINFYTRVATWLKLKADLPKIVDENIVHTWLEGFKLADKMETLEKSFAYQLEGIRNQTDKKPYLLHNSIEEYMEYVKSMKSKDSNEIIIKTDENDKTNNSNSKNEGE